MSPEMITAICTGIATLMASTGALIISLRSKRANKQNAEEQAARLEQIHVLVNSRLSNALERIALLTAELAEKTGDPQDKLAAAIAIQQVIPVTNGIIKEEDVASS